MGKRRILVIDDSSEIHKDFVRLLSPVKAEAWEEMDADGGLAVRRRSPSRRHPPAMTSSWTSLSRGQEGLAKVQRGPGRGAPVRAGVSGLPHAPGWNGYETLRHLRQVAPRLPVVLCSAYSDYSWEEIRRDFSEDGALKELRKPFGKEDLRQLTRTLTEEHAASH